MEKDNNIDREFGLLHIEYAREIKNRVEAPITR